MRRIRGTLATLADVRAQHAARRRDGSWQNSLIRWGDDELFERHVKAREPGDIVVVGARTNVGKSHFMIKLMRGAPCHSLYLSLEDSEAVIVDRTSQATDADERIIISRPRPITLSAIVEHIKYAALHHVPIGEPWIVCLDYIQLVQNDTVQQQFSQTQVIGATLAEIRALGEEYGFCTVVAAQIVRPPKKKHDDEDRDDDKKYLPPRPTLYDLRDSASIENAATVVVMLHGAPWTDWTEARIEKHKSGRAGASATYSKGPTGLLTED